MIIDVMDGRAQLEFNRLCKCYLLRVSYVFLTVLVGGQEAGDQSNQLRP